MEAVDLPFGLATSIGPVPTTEVSEAVDFALAPRHRFPTVPVLADVGSSMIAQAVSGVPGVRVVAPGSLVVDPDSPVGVDEEVGHDLGGCEFAALSAFLDQAFAPDADPLLQSGPLRVPLLGPVSLALNLVAAGVPTVAALDLARCLTERRAAALLSAVRKVKPLGVVAVVMSEPGLIGAMHPTFPLSPTQTRSLLDPVIDALDLCPSAGELLIGVHVPGRTDWETIVSSGVSMISAPADAGLLGWSSLVSFLLDRGGWIAWGAVPVDQPLGTTEELLWRRLASTWCDLAAAGVDPMLVRLRSMIGPADGLGHFGRSQAERVLELVESLAVRVQRQTIGARLSLGA